MGESIIDASRVFFEDIVRPILETQFPRETAVTAFGVFGYGSEALGLDDEYSRDHHWGLRIDAMMPEEIFEEKQQDILDIIRLRWGRWVKQGFPTTWENWNVDLPDGSQCHAYSAHPRYHLLRAIQEV
jgi:hypothetical protein